MEPIIRHLHNICERLEPQGFGLALRALICLSLMTIPERNFSHSENAQTQVHSSYWSRLILGILIVLNMLIAFVMFNVLIIFNMLIIFNQFITLNILITPLTLLVTVNPVNLLTLIPPVIIIYTGNMEKSRILDLLV